MLQFDVNRPMTGWRREYGLIGTCRIHKAASKQAFQAVVKFRKSNAAKRAKRIWYKKQNKQGKMKTCKHDRRPA